MVVVMDGGGGGWWWCVYGGVVVVVAETLNPNRYVIIASLHPTPYTLNI